MKNCLYTMANQLESYKAENGVLKRENEELRDAARAPKRARAGFSVKNMGMHLFSTGDMLEKARERKAKIEAKKALTKARKAVRDRKRVLQATAGLSGTSG